MSATQVLLNHEATLTVAFRDYSDTNDPGDLVDPDLVDLYIIENETTILTDTPTKIADGEYSYTYKFDQIGDFIVRFIGYFTDEQATPSSYEVTIEEEISVVAAFSQQEKLGPTADILFATDATPLYIDPEELHAVFPEANMVEILELVHRYSLEVDRILDNPDEISQLAFEFIRESVLCSLSAVYDPMSGSGGSISLGDLSINSGNRFNGPINRGNAATACERAFVLRQELLRNAQGSKAVVKGFRANSKALPDRSIKHQVRGDL